ncbi:hypothetical protein ACGYLO_21715 [Sulfitobacter sp. 1A13353]|uniref:hypothetical protein n=1 Tax=Sulfitobacter sp. 1A13353 TaxID=3368568 RepID=UPI00374509B9
MAAEGDWGQNNYYVRLSQVTSLPKDLLSKHASTTKVFWNCLANWLADNDYEFGRPTASASGTWKYVGLAMSQAFVRSSDRELFHDIFITYGFTASERLTVEELRPYLDEWMNSSKPNTRLKEAWKKKDLRNRLYEVALDEFYDWASAKEYSGSTGNRGRASTKRLTLLAAIVSSFPKRSLSLQLGRAEELSRAIDNLTDAETNSFALGNFSYGAFATLSPNPLGIDAKGFARKLVLRAEEEVYSWSSRLLIPLVKSEGGSYWSEVSRATFGVPHLLLVRNAPKIIRELEDFLSAASTGEAKQVSADQLDGLPAGWLLYTDVWIMRSDVEVGKDLQHIVPLSSDVGITVSEGLQLSRGVWHAKVPPKVHLVAESGPTSFELQQPRIHGDELIRTERNSGRGCTLRLEGLRDGSFFVTGYAGKNKLGEKPILLRSASRPRPLHRQESGQRAYKDLVSAAAKIGPDCRPSVRGHLVEGQGGAVEFEDDNIFVEGDTYVVPAGEGDREEDLVDFADVSDSGFPIITDWEKQSCAERGFHYWKCEFAPRKVSVSTPLQMQCKGCGSVVLMKNRGRRSASSKKVNSLRRLPGAFKTPPWRGEQSFEAISRIDHDLLFDALCFLGNGSFSTFERIVSDVELEPWRLGQTAAAYSALGLLDISYKLGTHRVAAWSVPPPALYMIGDTAAVLSGFRCESLTEELGNVIADGCGILEFASMKEQPTKVTVKGFSFNELVGVVEDVKDPLGRRLKIVKDFALEFSAVARSMGSYRHSLASVSLGSNMRNLQKFDVRKARWRAVEDCETSGAYRFDHIGRTYAFRAGDGAAFTGPQQIVKLLAARSEVTRLHAYEPMTRSFSSTLGAEPMGLLERALVSCSGELPSQEQEGLTTYPNVPSQVASSIMKILYDGENV